MKGALILIVVLAVLGGGYYWYSQNSASTSGDSMQSDDTIAPASYGNDQQGGVNVGVDVGVNAGVIKEFRVTGQPFSFSPSTMTVKKGDTVKLTFKNVQGTHDWRLDEFNAKTNVIQGGQEETIVFVADKVGTFEYYCSVGTHRAMGMKGTFVVTE